MSDDRVVVVISLRLETDLNARLGAVARLRGSTVTEQIRQAIAAHIQAATGDPALIAKGRQALDDIDREAKAAREAIASLLDDPT